MNERTDVPKKSIGEILQSANRTFLYLILFLVVSASLVVTQIRKVEVPTRPETYTIEAYKILRNVPEGGVVIVDTGFTARYLLQTLAGRGPNSIALCTMLDRPARRIVPLKIDFRCFEIPDRFVIGCGLDYRQLYRNLNFIAVLKPD
jgi:hypothetical protein